MVNSCSSWSDVTYLENYIRVSCYPRYQAAVGLLSPYANKLIKEQTTNADGSINTEANLMAHAVLGALEAHITGNNAAAGALGAFTAEAAAPYLMQAMYGTDKPAELTESQNKTLQI